MNGLQFIQAKQQAWAFRHNIDVENASERDERYYVKKLDDNLFQPLSDASRQCFNVADGNELNGGGRLPKMQAIHSSSALVVNLFQYWQGKDLGPLLYACGLSDDDCKPRVVGIEDLGSPTPKAVWKNHKPLLGDLQFEKKFRVSDDKSRFPRDPNVDVAILFGEDAPKPETEPGKGARRLNITSGTPGLIAIESKFSEPYNGRPQGLREAYVEDETLWSEIPHLYQLATELSPYNKDFRYLDAAQLLKHILGLKRSHGKQGFRLLYLWYDVLGEDGFSHLQEINRFAEIAAADGIRFCHVTVQQLIATIERDFRSGNEPYADYLADRYL